MPEITQPLSTLDLSLLAEMANAAATNIEEAAVTAVENAITCGNALEAAKAQVAHGEWSNWLSGNFDYSQRHAQRYMEIAANASRVSLSESKSIRSALRLIADAKAEERRQAEPKPQPPAEPSDPYVEATEYEVVDDDPAPVEPTPGPTKKICPHCGQTITN